MKIIDYIEQKKCVSDALSLTSKSLINEFLNRCVFKLHILPSTKSIIVNGFTNIFNISKK